MTLWQYQANLNKGALDPKLRGRIDTDVYYNGLETADNVRLTPQGAAEKRPGTQYIDTVPSDSVMRELKISDDLVYLLVFKFESSGASLPSRMYVYKNNVLQTNINGLGLDYLDISLGGPWDGADIGDTFVFLPGTPFTFVFAKDKAPAVISTTGDTLWLFATVAFQNVPQYDFADASSPTPTSQVQSLVFTNVNTSDRYRLSLDSFLTDDIAWSASTSENETRITDALQALPNTGNSGISVALSAGTTYTVTFAAASADDYGILTAVAVDTQSSAFSGEATITTPGVSRKEDAFSATRGWPQTGTFHQGRLWMANTDSFPGGLWGSVVDDFGNYDSGKARDDESVFAVLKTSSISNIYSLISSRKLQVFTNNGEFYCPEDVITPSNVRFEQFSNYGSARVQPAVIDGTVIYPQNNSRALIRSEITNQFQGVSSSNIGVLAPHLLAGITRVEIARGNSLSDANYIYSLNSTDSNVACLNYLPEESVEGFSKWETAQGFIKDICVVDDVLYLIVNRNGVWTLEMEDSNYPVDCGKAVTSQVTDMSYINNETIEIVGDGFYLGTFTASATTDAGRAVTSGYAGIAYRPILKTMPIVSSLANGPNAGRKKRVRRAIIRIYESNGIKVNDKDVPDRTIGVDQFSAPIPRTDIERVPLRGYAIDQQITVTQNTPYQFTVLSIGAELKV